MYTQEIKTRCSPFSVTNPTRAFASLSISRQETNFGTSIATGTATKAWDGRIRGGGTIRLKILQQSRTDVLTNRLRYGSSEVRQLEPSQSKRG